MMRTLAFVVALGLGACTAATDPRTDNSVARFGPLDGHWSGSIGIMEYDAQLVQAGVALGGTGAIGPSPASGAEFATRLTTIIGTDRASQVHFQFETKSGDSPTFTGIQLSTSEIRGAIGDGSGPGTPLTLYRR
jgi:hypothetical protein